MQTHFYFMSNSKIYEILYSLVPDWEGWPYNSEIRTFEYPIDIDVVDKLVAKLMDPLNENVVDGAIIIDVDRSLYDTLLAKAKELEPDWEEYASLEIYIPEAIHFIAYAKNRLAR